MIDIALKLIDRCISLVKRKEEVDRSLFTDFVQPLQNDFEKVHENYLNSFKDYRSKISSENRNISLYSILIHKISEDSIFSSSDRAKLNQLDRYSEHPVFGKYIIEIKNYLLLDDYKLDEKYHLSGEDWKQLKNEGIFNNNTRAAFANILNLVSNHYINKENYKEITLNETDKIIIVIQSHYEKVYYEYLELKDNLLIKY